MSSQKSKTKLLKEILKIPDSDSIHKNKESNTVTNNESNTETNNESSTETNYVNRNVNIKKTNLLKSALRIRTEFTDVELNYRDAPPLLRRPSKEWSPNSNTIDK